MALILSSSQTPHSLCTVKFQCDNRLSLHHKLVQTEGNIRLNTPAKDSVLATTDKQPHEPVAIIKGTQLPKEALSVVEEMSALLDQFSLGVYLNSSLAVHACINQSEDYGS